MADARIVQATFGLWGAGCALTAFAVRTDGTGISVSNPLRVAFIMISIFIASGALSQRT